MKKKMRSQSQEWRHHANNIVVAVVHFPNFFLSVPTDFKSFKTILFDFNFFKKLQKCFKKFGKIGENRGIHSAFNPHFYLILNQLFVIFKNIFSLKKFRKIQEKIVKIRKNMGNIEKSFLHLIHIFI